LAAQDRFEIKVKIAGKYKKFKHGSYKIKVPDFFDLVLTPQVKDWKSICGLVENGQKDHLEDFNVIHLTPLFCIMGLLIAIILMMTIVLNKFKKQVQGKRMQLSLENTHSMSNTRVEDGSANESGSLELPDNSEEFNKETDFIGSFGKKFTGMYDDLVDIPD
jgi:hypothetical protein